jgi:hypothetical protein
MMSFVWSAGIHEAGHVVVARHHGYRVRDVWVKGVCGKVRWLDDERPSPLLRDEPEDARCRLQMYVAGLVAEYHDDELDESLDMSIEEDRELAEALGGGEQLLVSRRLRAGGCSYSEESDEARAWDEAGHLCHYEMMVEAQREHAEKGGTPPRLRQYGAEDIIAEVERAEESVQTILRDQWSEVEAIARALRQADGHLLTGEQVEEVLRVARAERTASVPAVAARARRPQVNRRHGSGQRGARRRLRRQTSRVSRGRARGEDRRHLRLTRARRRSGGRGAVERRVMPVDGDRCWSCCGPSLSLSPG